MMTSYDLILLNLAVVVMSAILVYTFPVWIWRLSYFRKIRARILNVRGQTVAINYSGEYGDFARSSLKNGELISFYRLLTLENIVGDMLNDVVRAWSLFGVLFGLSVLGNILEAILTHVQPEYSFIGTIPATEVILLVLYPRYILPSSGSGRPWKKSFRRKPA